MFLWFRMPRSFIPSNPWFTIWTLIWIWFSFFYSVSILFTIFFVLYFDQWMYACACLRATLPFYSHTHFSGLTIIFYMSLSYALFWIILERFFIVFDQANTWASMHLLEEKHICYSKFKAALEKACEIFSANKTRLFSLYFLFLYPMRNLLKVQLFLI